MNELDITLKFLEKNGFIPDSSLDFSRTSTSEICRSLSKSNNVSLITVLKGELTEITFFGKKRDVYLEIYNSYIKQILREQQLDKIL